MMASSYQWAAVHQGIRHISFYSLVFVLEISYDKECCNEMLRILDFNTAEMLKQKVVSFNKNFP